MRREMRRRRKIHKYRETGRFGLEGRWRKRDESEEEKEGILLNIIY